MAEGFLCEIDIHEEVHECHPRVTKGSSWSHGGPHPEDLVSHPGAFLDHPGAGKAHPVVCS